MTTPVQEKDQYSFPAFAPSHPANQQTHERRSSDEDGTLQGELPEDDNHLRVTTSYSKGQDHLHRRDASPLSPSAQREASRRLDDDLELLQAERLVSNAEKTQQDMNRSKSMGRSRSRGGGGEPVDDFDIDTTPIHEATKIYQPPENPTTSFAKVFIRIHNSSFLVRWLCYIAPVAILLLIPVLLGSLQFTNTGVGGVELMWFGIWLEIVWLTLWAGRLLAKCIPYPMGVISSAFTNNSKKWRDLGKSLEIPATLFFWGLAIEVSFLPTMKNHHISGDPASQQWEAIVNKVIIAFFVACVLNFVEKIIIQLIAISFHLRTYADRIDINKFQNSSLVKLYIYSKEKIALEDSEFEVETNPASGARTPMVYVNKAQQKSRKVFNRVGDVAGKVAGDFTGKAVAGSNHPHQVVLQLLSSTSGAQVLARRLYRTFVHEDSETVLSDDLRPAFDNDDEANAAFTMFDKDLNGDISMEELEAVCVEIGRERKAITASLKDLDSVVSKLDSVFVFIVAVITVLVFVSIISTSASGVLTSLGSSVLALSWLFAATAQEFLQSIIFVFVKHPFDVGDRVTIYGNTGADMKGDDYFVKEIALLYTEFKKMEGHVVQAPNSYLNTLFILNQRRSGGLAEAVPVTIKFGTTLDQIDTLRARLLEFVTSEKREYQKNILTELRQVFEAHSITLNVIFFYKSNWQNELLRLQRRNKFICAMMVIMNELGIEGPRMRLAGATPEFPLHHHNAYTGTQPYGPYGQGPTAGREGDFAPDSEFKTIPEEGENPPTSHPSILRKGSTMGNDNGRRRGESISAMGKRVDFSLGMSSVSSGDQFGDVFDDPKPRLPNPRFTHTSPSPGPHGRGGRASEDNNSLAKTSSRDSHTGSNRTHRNRFFSRNKSRMSTDDGTSLEDLEAGTVRRDLSTHDMPDIPEASGANSAAHRSIASELERAEAARFDGVDRVDTAATRGRNGTQSSGIGKMDSRTGLVSSQAVARDSPYDREDLLMKNARE